ncbi:MAG: trypsin-like peptidase domain-containing protein [Planctomycetota bacterium]|nr:trypsin-like peptidase domain-containing protein [Planctomycetota bacterium]
MRGPSLLTVFLAGCLVSHWVGTPGAEAEPQPTDFSAVIERVDPGVVHITTVMRSPTQPRSRDDNVGSGFVVDAAGLIVTNRHVVSGAARVRVTVKGRGTVDAQVLGTDEATDVALLKVPLTGLTPVPLGDPRALKLGQWVLAAGSPYQLSHSWSAGIVSGLGRRGVGVNPRGYEDYIQTDAAANLGNSGGPLFDSQGRVVGVVTAILSRATGHQGITLAVPIDAVTQSVTRLRGGGAPARPSLGVRVREVRVGASVGLRITRFDPGSSAQAAGMRAGDVIVAAGGAPIRTTADLQRAVWSRAKSGRLLIVFDRGGRRMQLNVALR